MSTINDISKQRLLNHIESKVHTILNESFKHSPDIESTKKDVMRILEDYIDKLAGFNYRPHLKVECLPSKDPNKLNINWIALDKVGEDLLAKVQHIQSIDK